MRCSSRVFGVFVGFRFLRPVDGSGVDRRRRERVLDGSTHRLSPMARLRKSATRQLLDADDWCFRNVGLYITRAMVIASCGVALDFCGARVSDRDVDGLDDMASAKVASPRACGRNRAK